MRILLDTSILLRWLHDSGVVPPRAQRLIGDQNNLIAFSPLSIWECRIKEAKGRLVVPGDLIATLRTKDFIELKFTAEHADAAGALPPLHSDPFDRGLIAQARVEDFVLLTEDRLIALYDVRVELA